MIYWIPIIIVLLALVYLLLRVFFSFLTISLFGGAYFARTSNRRLKQVLKLANLKPGDKLLDLGSGDGQIVSAAAGLGVQADGVEINPFYVCLSRQKIKHQMLSGKAKIYQADLWHFNTHAYSVVVVYGIGYMMGRLRRKLEQELKPGTKVISVYFPFPGWRLVKKLEDVKLYIIDKI